MGGGPPGRARRRYPVLELGLERGEQRVWPEPQVARRHRVVETHRDPGLRPEADLRRKAVFEQVDTRAVEKRISPVHVVARDIGLLTGQGEKNEKQDRE